MASSELRLSGAPSPIQAERLRRVSLPAGLLLLGVIWYLDCVTGTELSVGPFYLLPIGIVTWGCGVRTGLIVSVLSTAAWLHADVYPYFARENWPIKFWNAGMKLCIFALVPLVVRRSEESSKLKSKMAAIVNREFAAALTNLRLAVSSLRESEPGPVPESRARSLGLLDRTTRHLSEAVVNFLELTRLETGRLDLRSEAVPVGAMVRETLSLLSPLVQGLGLQVGVEHPDGDALTVLGDRPAVDLILRKLLFHAFKLTPPGGAIQVGFAKDPPTTDRVRIWVLNTGDGISLKDHVRILMGFYRSEPAADLADGFGIGLKTVQDLLASMGSRLELETEPRQGSRFSFCLPLWKEESPT